MTHDDAVTTPTTTVTTYRLAYLGGEVSLCPECEEYWSGPELGPVQHGAHDGRCDGQCETARAARGEE